MNLLETLWSNLTTPDPPPHSGEAFGIWVYYSTLDSARSFCELALNHAKESELKAFIRDLVQGAEEPQLKRCEVWMKEHGVPFPQPFPRYSRVTEPVPAGARMQDLEIANMQVLKVDGLLNLNALNMAQALRNDLKRLYVTCFHELLPFGAKLQVLLTKHGWLQVPPPYHGGGEFVAKNR